MLVIHRKPNEAVVLTLPDGRTIRVVVCDVSRGKCRLGIECDRSIPVLRSELLADPSAPPSGGPANPR